MALQGSLGHLGLADLLQTGLTGQSPGVLSLRRGASRASLYVGEDGIVLLEPDVLDVDDLLRAFMLRGLVHEHSVEGARAGGAQGLQLIDTLVQNGSLPEAELLDVLAGWAEDTILDLLTWDRGEFRFDEGPLDMSRVGLVGRTSVDSGAVMLRAAQRIDERAAIAHAVGTQASLFVALPVAPPPPEHPGDPAPQVHMHLDGRTPLDEIALHLGIGRFAALRAAHALVEAGAARIAAPSELEAAISERLEANGARVARQLVLQWAEQEPNSIRPLERLGEIARVSGRVDEEVDAVHSTASLLISLGESERALTLLRSNLERYPHHPALLVGLRQAAESVGDVGSYVDSTVRMAQNAIHDGDGEAAAALLQPLAEARPDAISIHTLLAQALERCGRVNEFEEAAKRASDLIGRRCRGRREREAARYFVDAIVRIAPARTDLLKRFRNAVEESQGSKRKPAMVAALLILLAATGVALWPASPTSLLDKARAAKEAGEFSKANGFLNELIERYPDSTEADTGHMLLQEILRGGDHANRTMGLTAVEKQALQAEADHVRRALGEVPDPEAMKMIDAFVEKLESERLASVRSSLLSKLRAYVAKAMDNLDRNCSERGAFPDTAAKIARSHSDSPDVLRAFLAKVDEALDPAFIERARAALPVLERAVALDNHQRLLDIQRRLRHDFSELEASRERNEPGLLACRCEIARLEILRLEQEATTAGASALALGQIEQASEIFERLHEVVERIRDKDPTEPDAYRPKKGYKRAWEAVENKRILDLLARQRGVINDIRETVARAKKAEERGQIEVASSILHDLIKEYEVFQLERVTDMPLKIVSEPMGANVEIDGEAVGTTPYLTHYKWTSPVVVRVTAPGYRPVTMRVTARGEKPQHTVRALLVPHPVWSVPHRESLSIRPVDVNGNVMTTQRGGRMSLYDATTGSLRWSVVHYVVEGVRHQPVHMGQWIYVFHVRGSVRRINPNDGRQQGTELRIDRPAGDAAVLGDLIGVATRGDGAGRARNNLSLISDRGGRLTVARQIPLGGTPFTNVVAAHGAFWVGLAEGRLARIDPRSGRPTYSSLRDRAGSPTALAAAPDGIVVTTANGSLAYVDRTGSLRWQNDNLGSLSGRPASVGRATAVADQGGLMHLFDSRNGSPLRGFPMRAVAPYGLVAAQDVIVATLTDGRLLAVEPQGPNGPKVRVDAQLTPPEEKRPSVIPPAVVRGKYLVVRGPASELSLIPLPQSLAK